MAAVDCCCRMLFCSEDIEQHRIPEIRIDRVLDVRNRLRSGKYNIAERLDTVIDRLLEDILVQKPPKVR